MVSSLIDPLTRWWNVDLIRASFLSFEVDTILKIPLSHTLLEDKIIWIGNKRGEFSVKSAYHIAHNMIMSNVRGESSSGGTRANFCGKGFGISTCQQRSKFLLGEHVSMVSLLWMPFSAEGFLKIRYALFVVKMLKI